jgi:hypothetical protein
MILVGVLFSEKGPVIIRENVFFFSRLWQRKSLHKFCTREVIFERCHAGRACGIKHLLREGVGQAAIDRTICCFQHAREMFASTKTFAGWYKGCAASLVHPGGNPGANLKSISHRCHPILVVFVWELTEGNINLPLGCLQGGGTRDALHHWCLVRTYAPTCRRPRGIMGAGIVISSS